jgi:hypothetical protein
MAYVETYGDDGTKFEVWGRQPAGLGHNSDAVNKAMDLAIMRVRGPESMVRCAVHRDQFHSNHDRCPRVTVAEALLGRVCHLAMQEATS